MADYDIGEAFASIEDELIASMMRNMKRHKLEEIGEDKEWAMWQAMQLQSLENYKQQNAKKYKDQFSSINAQIEEIIRRANNDGQMEQEIEILEAIRNGFSGYHRSSDMMTAQFFRLNDRKLNALINATTNDMQKAETAILRRANDQYRKVIYSAQVYANTGAGTYEKAVDMATRDFLSAGIQCVKYKNGAMHTLSDYADMAIRTASKRAYLQGEGTKRQEWGIHTVILNKRGDNPCPKCLPFVGKVLIDDVWSGGSKKDGNYPLMSSAVAAGLYHPRCKDSHTTYFPGISTADDTWTKEELQAVEKNAKQEAKEQYAERQAERFGRLARYSLDEENQEWYRSIEKRFRKARFKTGGEDPRSYAADKNKHFHIDASDEYISKADIPRGNVSFEAGVNSEDKETALWLYEHFGGEIICLQEQSEVGKRPDSLWNGVYWEFKKPTSKAAIDTRIRKAQHQLQETLARENNADALRGMVIDISDNEMPIKDAVDEILLRTKMRIKGETDVIIRRGNEVIGIYKVK